MTTPGSVLIRSAFGSSIANAYLLVARPDEAHDARGLPKADARTFILRIHGREAVFDHELDLPIVTTWYSTSGTVYGGSLERNTIYFWTGTGGWKSTLFSKTPVKVVRSIFAIPGTTAEEDTVFLAARGLVFIRRKGVWTQQRSPGEGLPYHMAGSSEDEVYIGGSNLCLWNGRRMVELEGPNDDTIRSLTLSTDNRIVGGNTHIQASTSGGGWERIKTGMTGFSAFARLNDDVYALNDTRGLVRVYPGPAQVVSPALDARGLVCVGDGLIAFGKERAFLFDGISCRALTIPDIGPAGALQ